MIKGFIRKTVAISAAMAVLVSGISPMASSKNTEAVRYMPDVNARMSNYSYWADKVRNADRPLLSGEEIKKLNSDHLEAMKTNETPMYDLENWNEETFNGEKFVQLLEKDAESSAAYFYDGCGAKWDDSGNYYSSVEERFSEDILNCLDPDASSQMNVKYAICTKRTALMALPTDKGILDDKDDPDFDYRYLSVVNVNDPLVIKTKSADGKFYQAYSTCCSGWIPASDVAVCESREQWLDGWRCDDEKKLIVYGDRITTEDSNSTPEVASRTLYMGTALVLADESDINGRISNRTAHNNHVVWMPVRNSDGIYKKVLALIGENRPVSEGYLPLTTSNILMVALNQLGNCYGWGGMLGSDDCSGYMRDIYSCFGLELARSTSEQEMGFLKNYYLSERRDNGTWNLDGISDEKKAEIVRKLPPGSILDIQGHEMMYLGYEDDRMYVISSISTVRIPGDDSITRVRNVIINTLDMQRGDRKTWLHHLKYAIVPYYYATDTCLSDASVSGVKDRTYTGKKAVQNPVITCDERTLEKDVDYRLTYKGNVNAGTARMTVEGMGSCRGQLDIEFRIKKAKNPLLAKGRSVSVKSRKIKKKAQTLSIGKAVIFKNSGKGTRKYSLVSVKRGGRSYAKYLKINAKSGKITVKKGLKKGSYKVKILISASGSNNYKALTVPLTFVIKVK